MQTQDWQGKHLDKDILSQGNKVYSPVTCLFVSLEINLLLNERRTKRGKYKIGVHWHKTVKRFQSQLKVNSNSTHIGYFDTEQEAHDAYKVEKYRQIKKIALNQTEPLRAALLNYKITSKQVKSK